MSYSCDNNENIVRSHRLDHVKLGAGSNKTRKDGNDEKHQRQNLNEGRLVAVCDDSFRVTHLEQLVAAGDYNCKDRNRYKQNGETIGNFEWRGGNRSRTVTI